MCFAWFTALPTLPRTMPSTEQAWCFSLLKAPSTRVREWKCVESVPPVHQHNSYRSALTQAWIQLLSLPPAGWMTWASHCPLSFAFFPTQGGQGMKCRRLSQCLAPNEWQYISVIQIVIPHDIPEMIKVPVCRSTMKTAFKPFFTVEVMSVQRGIPLDREIQALAYRSIPP